MGKDSSPPPAPDYVGAAQAQGQANADAARISGRMNNPNINSPYGAQTVTWDAGGDQPTVTQTLNPQSQKIFDAQQQTRLGLADLSNRGAEIAGSVLDRPFSYSGPGVQTGLDTSGAARMPVDAGTTGYEAMMSRLRPEMDRQRNSLETQLTNQGLRPGSEAWSNAMTDLGHQQNDAMSQAAAQGVNLDMAANSQGFNEAQQRAQFANTAQGQSFAQQMQQRELPLNEITALMSGSQIQNPSFQGYSGTPVAPAPVMQGALAQGQAMQNAANQSAASSNATTSGLVSLGSTALMVY